MSPKTKKTTKKTGSSTYATKKYVMKKINQNVETKLNTGALITNFSSIDNTWTELNLTDIATGDDVSARTGREIKISAVNIDGVMVGGQSNSVADDNINAVRVVLGLWEISTPLTTNNAGLSSVIWPKSSYGANLVKKYMDKTIILRSSGVDSTGYMPAVMRLKKFIKMRRPITYNNTTSTSSNQFLMLSMKSDSSAVPNPGFVSGRWEVYFQDA